MQVPARFRLSPSAFAVGMRILLVVLNLLILALSTWELARARREQVERAEVSTQNLAQVLEQGLSGTFGQIDLVLLAIRDEARRLPAGLGDPGLASFIQVRLERLPDLERISLLGPEGASLQGPPLQADPAALQDILRRLRHEPGAGLAISTLLPQGRPEARSLVLARRIESPEGRFLGAVCAVLPLDQLARHMAVVDVGPHGTVSLRDAGLALLARHPTTPGTDRLLGDTRFTGDYLKALRNAKGLVHFTADSILDGERRTYTLKTFGPFQFHLLVGLAQSDYLQAWRRQAWVTGLAAAAIVALALSMGWLARSAWLRQLADQERLAQQEARFRLLADNALDVVWTLDPSGQLTYISPSIEKQRGWTPEEFLALDPSRRALSGPHAQMIQAQVAAAHAAVPGTQPFEHDRLLVPATCKDGHEIRVEAQWRIVWGEGGTLLGFQGVTRDVTEREQVIGELMQTLAEVKILGGMLPICAQCKKIRDDHGYWSSVETYLAQHTEATFTHGLCPECTQAFREEMKARKGQTDLGAPDPD